MTPWGRFLNFWLMRELGQTDTVLRNYDVLRYNGKGGQAHLWLAMKRLGEPVVTEEDALNMLSEIAQRFVNMGAPRPDYRVLDNRLRAWYTWDRINKGEVQQWFLSDLVKQSRSGY